MLLDSVTQIHLGRRDSLPNLKEQLLGIPDGLSWFPEMKKTGEYPPVKRF